MSASRAPIRHRPANNFLDLVCLKARFASLVDVPLLPPMSSSAQVENMEALWDFPSPLSINVRLQITRLLQVVPVSSTLAVLQQTQKGSMLLSQLSRFMIRPAYTMPITQAFRPLLVDLCVRWLDDDENLYEKFEALALLVEVHEEIYPYVLTSSMYIPYDLLNIKAEFSIAFSGHIFSGDH